MSNTNRAPAAPADCDHIDGCTSCGCSECGALVDRETMAPLTLPSGRVVWACRECLEPCDGCAVCPARSDGVPVEVAEDETVRETMTIETDQDGYHVAVVRKEVA